MTQAENEQLFFDRRALYQCGALPAPQIDDEGDHRDQDGEANTCRGDVEGALRTSYHCGGRGRWSRPRRWGCGQLPARIR